MNPIYLSNIFGKSPVAPVQEHMAKVLECVQQLPIFIEALSEGNWEQATKIQSQIALLEEKADKLKKKIRLNLPKSLFLAMSRRDLLNMLTMQDNVANKAKDIAGLMVGRKMTFPKQIWPIYKELINRCVDACAQAVKTVNELDELVGTGFRGREVKLVKKMLKELDAIETDTDRLQVDVRTALYAIEDEIPPLKAMFLYKIIDWTGDLGDLAQRVGSRLQLMLAR